MDHLLHHHRNLTFAAFFGLILASGLLVGRMTKAKGAQQIIGSVLLGVVAAGVAFWLTNLGRVAPMPGLAYTFVCGAVAICAMILPGVSGAYLLLVLGKYEHVTGILKSLPRGQATGEDLVTIAVFCAGCLTGPAPLQQAAQVAARVLLDAHDGGPLRLHDGFALPRVADADRHHARGREDQAQGLPSPTGQKAWNSEATWCLAVAVISFAGVLCWSTRWRRGSVRPPRSQRPIALKR